MKREVLVSCLIWACVFSIPAQEATDVETLKRQLKEATANFERAVEQHRQLIESLNQRIDLLQQRPGASATNITNSAIASVPAVPPPAPTSPATTSPSVEAAKWKPSDPITVMRAGSAYMNISFDAMIDAGWSTDPEPSRELELGHHDPLQRGFSLRNAEVSLDGAVDPYFKGYANLNMALDENQETEFEMEEAYLMSSALPANLQIKAGQFFADFGRQNAQHPHQWAFVDQPLILNRLFGPDGLRNVGGQLSWLAPTPFYSEAVIGMFNGQGEQAFSFRNQGGEDDMGVRRFMGRATLDRGLTGFGDFLFVPRLVTAFDLTPQQTLLMGASAAFAPNDTGPETRTQIYGLDLYWKWKSPRAEAGFPFVSLQTEGLYRRFEAGSDPAAGLPAETLQDWGFYAQFLWGFKPRWVTGMRGEYANGTEGAYTGFDPFRGERTRLSPTLTWYPSEFSKLRLQYNFDQGEKFDDEHSIWLQLEFLLGAHGAHKF